MTLHRLLFPVLLTAGLTAALTPQASAADAPPEPLTAAEAQRALAVLQDPAKRAAAVATLQAIAKAQPPAKPAASPKSFPEQALLAAAQWTQRVSREIAETARVMTHSPALWRWAAARLTNPSLRGELYAAATALAIVLGCAALAGWAAGWAIRRPIAGLAVRAPDDPGAPPEAGRRHRRAARLLRRLPFALVRLLLELFPAGLIALIGNLLPAAVSAPMEIRLVVLAIVNAYALGRALMAAARMLLSPSQPRLRLLLVGDAGARYLETRSRHIVYLAVFGGAIVEVALLLGLDPAAARALMQLVSLAVHVMLAVLVIECRRSVAERIRAPGAASGGGAELRNWLAHFWHYIAIVLILGSWVAWAIGGGTGLSGLLRFLILTSLVLILSRVAAIVLLGSLERLLRVDRGADPRLLGTGPRARRYEPMLRRALSGLTGVVTALALLEVWGLDAFRWFAPGRVGGRVASALAAIAVTAAIAALVWEFVNAAIERRVSRLAREAPPERLARLQSLLPMLRTALLATILVMLGLTILGEIGVNIAPLLAGAGILGIAVGFGSQKLVQDLVTGVFLLFENALRVGDAITVAGLSGTVENLSVRNIWLRAPDGAVNIIPFSSVTSITNASRGRGNAAITVTVTYGADIEQIEAVLADIAAELRRDPEFAPLIVGDFELWGVDRVTAAEVTIVGQIPCTDAGRWRVQRAFNLRLIKRFQALGVEIAKP